MESTKPVNTLVLDAGGIIKNEPPVSTLLSKSETLITVPEIVGEIKDAATRSRVQTTLLPFLKLRSPSPTSVKFVTDFARRTGDLAVLSKPDIQIIALTYELECELNGGDWRLRNAPGQKRVNGAPPGRSAVSEIAIEEHVAKESPQTSMQPSNGRTGTPDEARDNTTQESSQDDTEAAVLSPSASQDTGPVDAQGPATDTQQELASRVAEVTLSDNGQASSTPKIDSAQNSAESQEDSSDSEGWITPSNLKKKQAQDAGASTTQADEPKMMQAAVLTTDFAMQNVILQINLNLLSPSLTRVKHLKTFVLRCHACFQVTKDMSKQFCPRCGQPSLTRVSCSTNANGEFKLHLKNNMQWNHRGERYSVPKPVHGAANGKVKGGGKGGWGNELMLAEDQKEYQRATRDEKRAKERSLMDEDYLPSILTGDRSRGGGRALTRVTDEAVAKVISSSFSNIIPDCVDATSNGFVKAAIKSYNHHQHLKIRPDEVWLAILIQFGSYVNAHAHDIRSQIVSHEGKMELSVVHNLAVPPEEVGWTGFAKRITDQANKCLKDSGFKTWAVPTFSTTTETDKTVACVAMMGCLKEYFSYAVDLLCGLPSVTLLGQKKDYENILDRVEKLRDVSSGGELTQFADLLKPVIQHFILSFDAPESDDVRSFWGKIFTTITNGSGPIHWSGWLTAFMFWDKDGQPVQKKATPSVHNKHEQLVLHGLKYPIIPNEMPPGFCTVPVKIVLSDRSEIQAEMLAGSVGIQASSSDEEMANGQKGYDTRQPVSGWWVYEKGGQPLRNGARADSIDR